MEKMFGEKRLVTPEKSYFEEKADDDDFAQVNALPLDLQIKLLDGTPKDYREALQQIRLMEHKKRGPVLGLAAIELIEQVRAGRGSDQPQQPLQEKP